MKDMNYVTHPNTPECHLPADSGEKMEPEVSLSCAEREMTLYMKAFMNGISAQHLPPPQLAESCTYMADYIADDQGRILAVRYDPVRFTVQRK